MRQIQVWIYLYTCFWRKQSSNLSKKKHCFRSHDLKNSPNFFIFNHLNNHVYIEL